jgi:hypothetical protein
VRSTALTIIELQDAIFCNVIPARQSCQQKQEEAKSAIRLHYFSLSIEETF